VAVGELPVNLLQIFLKLIIFPEESSNFSRPLGKPW